MIETVWDQGYRQIGAVLQSCLRRSEEDARRLSRLGIPRPSREGRVQRACPGRLSEESRGRRGVRAHHANAPRRKPVSGDRHAGSGDDRRDDALRRRPRRGPRPLRVPDVVRHPAGSADRRSRETTRFASTFRSGTSGTRISCVASASVPRTSGSSWEASSRKSAPRCRVWRRGCMHREGARCPRGRRLPTRSEAVAAL